jgi:hypothetical protein
MGLNGLVRNVLKTLKVPIMGSFSLILLLTWLSISLKRRRKMEIDTSALMKKKDNCHQREGSRVVTKEDSFLVSHTPRTSAPLSPPSVECEKKDCSNDATHVLLNVWNFCYIHFMEAQSMVGDDLL